METGMETQIKLAISMSDDPPRGARSVSRASSGASGGSRRPSDFKRSPRSCLAWCKALNFLIDVTVGRKRVYIGGIINIYGKLVNHI